MVPVCLASVGPVLHEWDWWCIAKLKFKLCMTCTVAYRLLMNCVNGTSPQQIGVHILISLANKYPCSLQKFLEKVSFLITCFLCFLYASMSISFLK